MNLLVIGTSNSAGEYLPNQNDGWPWVLARRLSIGVVHKNLYVTGHLEYLDKQLRENPFDVLVLFAAPVATPTISQSAAHKFGNRTGAAVVRTRNHLGAGRLLGRIPHLYKAVRWAGRKAIGAETPLPIEEVIRRFGPVLDRLHSAGAMKVLVLKPPTFGDEFRYENPDAVDDIGRFNEALPCYAADYGFTWLDTDQIISANGTLTPRYVNSNQFGEEAHALFADAVGQHLEPLLKREMPGSASKRQLGRED